MKHNYELNAELLTSLEDHPLIERPEFAVRVRQLFDNHIDDPPSEFYQRFMEVAGITEQMLQIERLYNRGNVTDESSIAEADAMLQFDNAVGGRYITPNPSDTIN
jgi:hypothetical protein